MKHKLLKMKTNHLKIIAIFALLLFVVVYACQKEMHDSFEAHESSQAIEMAKSWYEMNKPGILGFRSSDGTEQIPMIPVWTNAFSMKNEKYEVVEADLMIKGIIRYTDRDCMEKYRETKDMKYKQSYARIVFQTDRKTNETKGFLMTIVPNLEWLEKSNFKPFMKTNYLDRGKDFGGRILFHNMDGSFSNGWTYEKGKIVASISAIGEDPAKMSLRSTECYYTDYYYEWESCTDYYSGSEEYGFHYAGTICHTYWEYEYSLYECYDDGTGGGGAGGGGSGSGGNGSSGGNYPVVTCTNPEYSQIAAAINQLIPQIYNLLLAKGVNISDFQFRVADFCDVNARYIDGFIELCTSFLNWGIYDQASIIWHEIYHLLYDLPWSTSLHPLSQTIILNPPSWVEYYIRTYLVGDFGEPSYLESLYQSYITFNSIRDPQYYQNEINAYQAERNAMPDSSSEYQATGDYQLWLLQQLLEIANTYY